MKPPPSGMAAALAGVSAVSQSWNYSVPQNTSICYHQTAKDCEKTFSIIGAVFGLLFLLLCVLYCGVFRCCPDEPVPKRRLMDTAGERESPPPPDGIVLQKAPPPPLVRPPQPKEVPPPPPPTAGLPHGWAAKTTDSGQTYYFNAESGEVSWTMPTSAQEAV